MTRLVLSLCIGLLLSIGTASAETKSTQPKERTAKSLECSKQADEKNLHGKPRKTFMRACKKEKS